jgi:hypothetical protein
LRPEVGTLVRRDITYPLVIMGKRKPRWFQETLKKSKENVGEPKKLFRETKAPKRLGSYLAMVTSVTDAKPMTFTQVVD